MARVATNVPLGRLGSPDDMGSVAVFLASDDSSYVNGIELFADGGVAQYWAIHREYFPFNLPACRFASQNGVRTDSA